MTWALLSHPLSTDTPGYGGASGMRIASTRRICEGHSSNNQEWTLSNHIGTHVDAPFHFAENGRKLDEFSPEFWVCNHPVLIDRPAVPGELIGLNGVQDRIPENADFMILRTGFEAVRSQSVYWENNPGIAPELGRWLRQNRPALRFIGFDLISLSSYQNRMIGRESHQVFLRPASQENPGNPILIVEDMCLAHLIRTPKRVVISPLFVQGADGAPVTVWAEMGE